MLKRVFQEHFEIKKNDDGDTRLKSVEELSAHGLQPPNDWEATYRKKRGEGHHGYVANINETCDPENDLQLIVSVQVELNTTDDAVILEEKLPELTERTDVEEMYNDGGFNSPGVDEAMQECEVQQFQSAIRGRKPSSEKLHLDDFEWDFDEEDQPTEVTFPEGHTADVEPGRKEHRFLAYFDQVICRKCPLAQGGQCPTVELKRKPQRILRFSLQQFCVARRRQRSTKSREEGQNLRAAVESTVGSVKHPFALRTFVSLMVKCQSEDNLGSIWW